MTEQQYSVIFFHPPDLRVDEMKSESRIMRFLMWVALHVLIWVIVKLETPRLPAETDSPYTHCGISDGVEYLDATLGRKFPAPVDLSRKQRRAKDFWGHTEGVLADVYEEAKQKATAQPPMWEGFSLTSLLWLIGIGLLAESRFERVASWIVRGLANQPGLYCSEFVAEVIADFGGEPLYVWVDADRVPTTRASVDKATFVARVRNRNEVLASNGTVAVDPVDAWNAFREWGSESVAGGYHPVLVAVGYGQPGGPPMIPPFLVGLSDLAGSPQLAFDYHLEPLPGPPRDDP